MKINPELKEELRKYLEEQIGREKKKVTIVSAYPLSHAEKNAIVIAYPGLNKELVENIVDKTIVGGIIIKFGSKIIDLSIRSALHTFMQHIYETH